MKLVTKEIKYKYHFDLFYCRSAGSVEEGWTSPGSETAWSPDRAGSGGATSGAGAPGQQEAWQSPENRNKIPSLSVTKEGTRKLN